MIKILNKYIIRFRTSDLVKVSSKNTIQIFLQFVLGLLKIKVISVWLGPSGMALLSQFANFTQMSTSIAHGGITNGVTGLTAKFSKSKMRKTLILSNSIFIVLICSIPLGTILFLFPNFFSLQLLYSNVYADIFRFAGIFIFCSALTSVVLSYLKGDKKHSKFIILNIIIIVVSFVLMVVGAYFWGLKGAIWSQLLTFLITGVYVFFSMKLYKIKLIFGGVFGRSLLGYSLMFIVAAIIAPLVQIIVRNIIVGNCSVIEAGWWDGVKRISITYTALIISTVSLYFLPRISELTSAKAVRKEIRSSLIIVLPLVALGSAIIYFSRNLIIDILFTSEFEDMSSLFLYQCAADVIKIAAWFYAIMLTMRAHTKAYIFSEIFMFIVIVVINSILIPQLGIEASTLCALISNSIYLLLMIVLTRINLKG